MDADLVAAHLDTTGGEIQERLQRIIEQIGTSDTWENRCEVAAEQLARSESLPDISLDAVARYWVQAFPEHSLIDAREAGQKLMVVLSDGPVRDIIGLRNCAQKFLAATDFLVTSDGLL